VSFLDAAWLRYERLARPLFLPLALVVFTASGFSGLIYESIWTHYLKLFLGHAAYAQTLVLAIFMGGMALGAWAASRLSPRWRNLLLAYAIVEALIGLASLAFHDLFVAATGLAFERVIPAIGSPGGVYAFKWTLAAALILPQSVLLGMTFPLMTGGVLRIEPHRSGYAIAMLYFTNSLGAGIGVLASGFYFIPEVGLPGALAGAAVINLAAAAAAALLPRAPAPAPQPPRQEGAGAAPAPLARLLLVVAALTGMSSFMYEIGWIRMLSLVLGASTHAFELMLSAFILGLAFGGLWVRRRIDAAKDTVRLLALVQLAMGVAALATLPVYGGTFHAMRWLIQALVQSPSGYALFNVASHGLALAVMFPAAFFAGMTLPLITATLLRLGRGERAVGQTYAANTAGAIAGVLLAVHVGLPALGVKGLIVAGALVDLVLGAMLLATLPGTWRRASVAAAAAVSLLAVGAAIFGVTLDAHQMASGVYRHGLILDRKHEVLFHQDGKTATISVTRWEETRTLRTNGKPDGAVRLGGVRDVLGDEATMVLLGALPVLLKPQAREVANIGFGTGITTHVLLASPAIERVDTVEIEPAVLRGSAFFRKVNFRAYDDPRSRIHYEDAKTFFASRQKRYDVIVSEPSNPWVSGVASLFSTEFYADLRKYLNEGGLLVQWVQLYEFSPQLLASVVEALRPHFSDYVLWMPNDGDLVIIAANGGRVPEPDPGALARLPQLAAVLSPLEINNLDDLGLRRLTSRESVGPYLAAYGMPGNSDYFPILDVDAPLARFMGISAAELIELADAPLPVMRLFERRDILEPDPARLTAASDQRRQLARGSILHRAAATDIFLSGGERAALASLPPEYAAALTLVRATLFDCRRPAPDDVSRSALFWAASVMAHLPGPQATRLSQRLAAAPCAAYMPAQDRDLLRLYVAVLASRPQEMAAAAKVLLDTGYELTPNQTAYVVAAGMTGDILSGKAGPALEAFGAQRAKLQKADRIWQAVFRHVVAQADQGAPARPD